MDDIMLFSNKEAFEAWLSVNSIAKRQLQRLACLYGFRPAWLSEKKPDSRVC